MLEWMLIASIALSNAAMAAPAVGQAPAQTQTPGQIVDELTSDQPSDDAGRAPASDPWVAFAQGDYAAALEGFTGLQVRRPHDADALLNVGAAQYKVGDYDAAFSAFARASSFGDGAQRASALYNLGNTAYRQGKLDEAVTHYQAALTADPEDEDAKFNLEFVRNEIRRRAEEAKKRQDQQSQDQQGRDQQGQDQQGQDQQGQDQQGQDQQGKDQQGKDSDQDGLDDATEQQGANPTDPQNDDSDGDGLKDGEEDANHNGQRDEGETDPNQQDTDGDGIPDAEDPHPTDASEGQAEAAPDDGEMSPEEAARYLSTLDDQRPPPEEGDKKRGRAVAAPGGMDW